MPQYVKVVTSACLAVFGLIIIWKNMCQSGNTIKSAKTSFKNHYIFENIPVDNIQTDRLQMLAEESFAKFSDLSQSNSKLQWNAPDPEMTMNATQLIASKGFPYENHYVQTNDGFILGMQRIPQPSKSRLPVLLIHGLLSSSDCFLTNLVNESLAYILYKAGYDVWLGNVRGNTYSTRHATLSPRDLKFWKWSFDEMARYDIPVMVDYVLQQTGHAKLNYVGHSQGTTTFFGAGIKLGKVMSSKVNKFFALAPAAHVPHMRSPLHYLAYVSKDILDVYYLFGDGKFLPHKGWIAAVAHLFCPHDEKLCENVLFLLGGTDFTNMNRSRVPVYTSHNPAGTSTQNMVHWAQMFLNKKNKMLYYDYGNWISNYFHYSSIHPPSYDLSTFEIPTYAFCGTKDTIVVQSDCEALLSILPNVKKSFMIPGYTHLDFIWAINAANDVYSYILDNLA